MNMKKKSINYLVEAGLIAAIYAAATYAAAAMGLAYSGVQFRISEALTVLAVIGWVTARQIGRASCSYPSDNQHG